MLIPFYDVVFPFTYELLTTDLFRIEGLEQFKQENYDSQNNIFVFLSPFKRIKFYQKKNFSPIFSQQIGHDLEIMEDYGSEKNIIAINNLNKIQIYQETQKQPLISSLEYEEFDDMIFTDNDQQLLTIDIIKLLTIKSIKGMNYINKMMHMIRKVFCLVYQRFSIIFLLWPLLIYFYSSSIIAKRICKFKMLIPFYDIVFPFTQELLTTDYGDSFSFLNVSNRRFRGLDYDFQNNIFVLLSPQYRIKFYYKKNFSLIFSQQVRHDLEIMEDQVKSLNQNNYLIIGSKHTPLMYGKLLEIIFILLKQFRSGIIQLLYKIIDCRYSIILTQSGVIALIENICQNMQFSQKISFLEQVQNQNQIITFKKDKIQSRQYRILDKINFIDY